MSASGGSVTPVGAKAPGNNVVNPADALDVRVFLEALNGAGQWDQVAAGAGLDATFGQRNTLAVQDVVTDGRTGAVISKLGVSGFRTVSAANTQVQNVLEIRNLATVLDIVMVASGGTAAVTIEASVDNANWITVDAIAAALTTAKHYNNSTVGATTAITPLAFRFVRITIGAAGAGFTTTTTVSAK